MTCRKLPGPTLLALPLALGMLLRQPWAFAALPLVFGAVVVVDQLRPRAAPAGLAMAGGRLALWLWLPIHVALLAGGVAELSEASANTAQAIRQGVAVGFAAGLFGMPVAHELLHSGRRIERAMAEAVLALVSYTHFRVEHVGGHHRRVATPQDNATARLGETLYAFVGRSLLDGWRSAWRLEARRQQRTGRHVLGLRNTVVRGHGLSAVLYGTVAACAGTPGLLFLLVQALVAVFLVETINYVQHYGLCRPGDSSLAEAPVAWNSDAPAGNWLLLNLGRHSDHHGRASVPCSQLRTLAAAPNLPAGLPGMTLLALLPPLWFRVMDPLAARWAAAASRFTCGPACRPPRHGGSR